MILSADLIRAARALLNWTQEHMATQCDITAKSLGDIESGRRKPTANTSAKIRKVLEEAGVQFIAANSDGSEIVGAGIRWRPEQPSMSLKVI